MIGPEGEKQMSAGLLNVAFNSLKHYTRTTLDIVVTYIDYCSQYGNDMDGRHLSPQDSTRISHSDSATKSMSNIHHYCDPSLSNGNKSDTSSNLTTSKNSKSKAN